jgi:hypothetical protein
MADFSALKEAIQDYIKQNGNEEITGEKLQTILLSIVNTLGDSAINDLITALNAEVASRQNADGSLEGAINQEGILRSNADSTLQGNINAEATARENADTALSNRLGSTITAENTAAEQIGAEAEARAAADTALRGLIDGITDNIENGYVYAGIATPSSTPATGKVFYLALTAGTYTHFGNTVVTQGINILKYNGSAWSLDAFIGIDDELTPISNNLPKSGNVLENIIKNGSAFDLSAYNAVDGVPATYADQDAALAALSLLPAIYKQPRMSFRFVLTSDNKYVQYRLKSTSFNTTTSNWVNVEDELVEERNARKLADTALQNAISTQNTEIDEFEDTIRTQIDEYLPIQIEGNVTNAPDEEDLTSVNQGGTDVLKFKNRNNLHGMGMIILRRDKTFAEQLTQTNTIYVIQYDFTLTGDVTIPENCILKFDGGSLSNGVLNCNNCGIEASETAVIFKSNLNIKGVREVCAAWIGVVPTAWNVDSGSDKLIHFTQANENGYNGFTIKFLKGVYCFTLADLLLAQYTKLIGAESKATKFVINAANNSFEYIFGVNRHCRIADIDLRFSSYGVSYANCDIFRVSNKWLTNVDAQDSFKINYDYSKNLLSY